MLAQISQVTIEEGRHRKVFDQKEIDNLAESIAQFGVLHPPVVREDGNGGFLLMAGERRMRAIKQLHATGRAIPGVPPGMMPYTLFENIDPIMAKEIELEENLRRVDLSWKETALATAELHKMRKEADPNWTAVKTVEEIRERGGATLNPTVVRNRTLLAENLNRPEVASASSEAQAMKNLTRILETEFRTAMAKKIVPVSSTHILENIDAVEGIKQFVTPASVDVVITDPPYGINAGEFGVETVIETHNYSDSWEETESLLANTITALTAVCKEQAHLYMFCDLSHWIEIREILELNDWEVWNRPLVWVKNTGYTPKPHYGPRRNYETIIFANRGKRMVTGVYSDVLVYPAVVNKIHAAQKPVDLYRDLLLRSVIPGSVVLDPFCGSGVVFEAARALNLRAIGFDNDPAAFAIASGRLNA
jgi:DNA modification methylase